MQKKGLEEFREEVLNGHTFDGKFKGITSMDEVYQIAKNEGYEFSKNELEDCEITDDILDSVAGGVKNEENEDTFVKNVFNYTPGLKYIEKD